MVKAKLLLNRLLITWKGLRMSLKETTITRSARQSNRSCSTPGESFDQSNSTSRENTSTVFDDTFSTKVKNSDTFPIIVENSDTSLSTEKLKRLP